MSIERRRVVFTVTVAATVSSEVHDLAVDELATQLAVEAENIARELCQAPTAVCQWELVEISPRL